MGKNLFPDCFTFQSFLVVKVIAVAQHRELIIVSFKKISIPEKPCETVNC